MFQKNKPEDEEEEFEVPEFHRDLELDEDGIEQVVIEQFVTKRLPQLLKIKQEMDAGKVLTDGELELLSRIVARAHNVNHFVYEHPDLADLVARIIDLVHDITGEALANATGEEPPAKP